MIPSWDADNVTFDSVFPHSHGSTVSFMSPLIEPASGFSSKSTTACKAGLNRIYIVWVSSFTHLSIAIDVLDPCRLRVTRITGSLGRAPLNKSASVTLSSLSAHWKSRFMRFRENQPSQDEGFASQGGC